MIIYGHSTLKNLPNFGWIIASHWVKDLNFMQMCTQKISWKLSETVCFMIPVKNQVWIDPTYHQSHTDTSFN